MSKIYSFNNSLVQAGNNLLAGEPGGTGPTYIPGQYISIEDDVISVTGLQPEGDYATEAELQTVSAAIPDVSNLASKSEVQAVADDVQIVSAAIPDTSNFIDKSNLIGGENVTISVSGDDVIVETTEMASGMQVVAGDNINLTVSGDLLVISASGGGGGSDETVIFSTGSDSSCTLTEAYTNFEKIGIFYGIETNTSSEYCQVPKEQLMLSADISRLNGWGIWLNDFRCDGNNGPTSLVFRWSRWRFTNSTTLSKELGYQMVYSSGSWGAPSSTQYACYISKIIGINRISS